MYIAFDASGQAKYFPGGGAIQQITPKTKYRFTQKRKENKNNEKICTLYGLGSRDASLCAPRNNQTFYMR